MNRSFGSLAPGDLFHADGKAFKKLDAAAEAAKYPAMPDLLAVLDNAVSIGGSRGTRQFSDQDRVETPERSAMPIFWRRWCLSRALRWHFAGFPRWAAFSWRMSRLWASETTHMHLAAYATHIMMLGE